MAELATIARPYAEALFLASKADLSATAAWLDEISAIASNAQLVHESWCYVSCYRNISFATHQHQHSGS